MEKQQRCNPRMLSDFHMRNSYSNKDLSAWKRNSGRGMYQRSLKSWVCAEGEHGAVCSQQQLVSTKRDYQMGSSQKTYFYTVPHEAVEVFRVWQTTWFLKQIKQIHENHFKAIKNVQNHLSLSKVLNSILLESEKVQGTPQVFLFFCSFFFSHFALEGQRWPKKVLVWFIMPILTFMESLRSWLLGVYQADGYTNAF